MDLKTAIDNLEKSQTRDNKLTLLNVLKQKTGKNKCGCTPVPVLLAYAKKILNGTA